MELKFRRTIGGYAAIKDGKLVALVKRVSSGGWSAREWNYKPYHERRVKEAPTRKGAVEKVLTNS